MKSLLFREIFAPILTRLGTAAAAFLIGKTVADPQIINEFVAAAGALVLVSVDLVTNHYSRKSEK